MLNWSLDKFEALGNDFLVLVDPEGATPISASHARALCERHRGVGADGLIRLAPGADGELAMELYNADGTPAETSGNGLRCAAFAAVRAGIGTDEFVIATVAGPARCAIRRVEGEEAFVRAEMGSASVVEEHSPLPGRRAFRVDVGNPHLVLIGDRGDVAIAEIGARLEWAVAGGQNIELVSVLDDSTLTLEVYERGAGLTEACGSGSVAAAAAARFAGLAGSTVTVANPGGDLTVELDSATPPHAALSGPARHVAGVTVDSLRPGVGVGGRL